MQLIDELLIATGLRAKRSTSTLKTWQDYLVVTFAMLSPGLSQNHLMAKNNIFHYFRKVTICGNTPNITSRAHSSDFHAVIIHGFTSVSLLGVKTAEVHQQPANNAVASPFLPAAEEKRGHNWKCVDILFCLNVRTGEKIYWTACQV